MSVIYTVTDSFVKNIKISFVHLLQSSRPDFFLFFLAIIAFYTNFARKSDEISVCRK